MNFEDRINAGEFETIMEFPKRPTKPFLSRVATSTQTREYADKLEEYETAMVVYNLARDSYYAAVAEAKAYFKKALFEELGLTDHPKADELYRLAYERGHSHGHTEIYWEVEGLVKLLRQINFC